MTATTLETVSFNTVAPIPCQGASVETETADTGSTRSRTASCKGTRIVPKNDSSLCMHVGLCGNEITTVWKMLSATCDSRVRGQLMAIDGNGRAMPFSRFILLIGA